VTARNSDAAARRGVSHSSRQNNDVRYWHGADTVAVTAASKNAVTFADRPARSTPTAVALAASVRSCLASGAP